MRARVCVCCLGDECVSIGDSTHADASLFHFDGPRDGSRPLLPSLSSPPPPLLPLRVHSAYCDEMDRPSDVLQLLYQDVVRTTL